MPRSKLAIYTLIQSPIQFRTATLAHWKIYVSLSLSLLCVPNVSRDGRYGWSQVSKIAWESLVRTIKRSRWCAAGDKGSTVCATVAGGWIKVLNDQKPPKCIWQSGALQLPWTIKPVNGHALHVARKTRDRILTDPNSPFSMCPFWEGGVVDLNPLFF